jgi:DNA ligase (NAD+)
VRDKPRGKKKFEMPARCPRCGTTAVRPADEVMTYCTNVSCPGRVLEGIVHYASRGAMDVRGLGYERVQKLLDAKLIANVADLYRLSPGQLLEVEGFADKSAQQLVTAIAASKAQPLSRLLFGLGIRHVGDGAAELLARRFGTMPELRAAAEPLIGDVRGIGPTIAEAVHEFFADPRNAKLVDDLASLGLTLSEPTRAAAHGPLTGGTFVLTGTLPTLSRGEATQRIEAAGGSVTGSVSKQTTAVIAGEEAGGKLDKAKQLGVPVWDERTLLDKLGNNS